MKNLFLSEDFKKALLSEFAKHDPKIVGLVQAKKALNIALRKKGIEFPKDVYKILIFLIKAAGDNPNWLDFLILFTQELYIS